MYDKLAKIQDEIPALVRDKDGYGYKYADLNQLMEKLTPLLRKYKLVLTQPLVAHEHYTSVLTRIDDLESDAHMTSEILLPTDIQPQKMGAAITYYRRYSLGSLLALQTEDDDDAESTNPKKRKIKSPVDENEAPFI